MDFIVRTEPVGSKYLEGYPQFKEMLQQIGWLQFLEKFNGFHKEVTKTFARSFQGTEVEVSCHCQIETYQSKVQLSTEAYQPEVLKLLPL